jgi:hypothetical protein
VVEVREEVVLEHVKVVVMRIPIVVVYEDATHTGFD